MAYKPRNGDIIALSDPEAGAMTMSQPLSIYSPSGGIDGPGLYRQDAVRTVVGFIASNQASIPLDLYRRDDDNDRTKVRDSPLAAALRSPLQRQTQLRFLEALALDMLLHDRWVFLVTQDGPRLRWRRIPAQQTSFLIDGFGEVQSVRVYPGDGGRPRDVPAERCVWDLGYDPAANASQTIGSPVAPTLSTLVTELRRGSEYREQMYENGARIPAYVHRPAEAPKWVGDTRTRFIESFGRYTASGGRAGGTPLLEDGMKILDAPTHSPAETQWLEARKLTIIEVSNFFHIPPELVGAREGNYSNVQAYREQLYRDVLGPRLLATEQAFNVGLTEWLGEGEYIEANVNAKLRGSFEERAKVMQSSVGAPWMTRNEARALDNRPALDGGDDLITPLNVVTGSVASPRDTAPPPKAHPAPRTKSGRPDDLAPLATEQAALVSDVDRFWARQVEHLRKALDLKAIPSLPDAFDVEAWSAELEQILRGRSLRISEAAAWEVLQKWNPDADGWSPEVMSAWLAAAAANNSRRYNQGLYDRIGTAIATGEGWTDKTDEVLSSTAVIGAWKHSFVKEPASFGAHDAARASGLGSKTWHVTSANPRPSHGALDGQTVAVDDIFGNGCRWPGDSGGGADETAGCTCIVTYSKGD